MLPLSLRKSGFLFTLSKLRKSHQISPIGWKANVIFDTNSLPHLLPYDLSQLTATSLSLYLIFVHSLIDSALLLQTAIVSIGDRIF